MTERLGALRGRMLRTDFKLCRTTAKWLRVYYTKRGGARPVGSDSEAVVTLRGAYASGMVAAPLGRSLQAASGVSVATWT